MIPPPPLGPLVQVVASLEASGIVCALGGSGLMASLGLTERVRDWDLTTDDTLERIRTRLERFEHALVGPSGVHADSKFVLLGGRIEIIIRVALRHENGIVRIPTLVTDRWNGVPVGSPLAWAVAYRLLGRLEKSEALFDHVERHGADPGARANLLKQPLPADLHDRLANLGAFGPSSDA